MNKTIALIPGDGIGPDVVAEAVNVLNAVAKKYGHSFSYKEVPVLKNVTAPTKTIAKSGETIFSADLALSAIVLTCTPFSTKGFFT